MKKNYFIKYILNGITHLWLLGSILQFVFALVFLTTKWDGYITKSKYSSLNITNIFSGGYPVPTKLTVNMPPDTVVNYKKGNTAGSFDLYKTDVLRWGDADSLLKDTSIEKQITVTNWVLERGYASYNRKQLTTDKNEDRIDASVDRSYFLEATVKLKSSNRYHNFMFALHSFLNIIVSLLISFNLSRLTHYILTSNIFLSILHQKIRLVGIILIASQVISFLLAMIYARWFGLVHINPLQATNMNCITAHFNPTFNFSGTLFIGGLALFILSTIFKHGHDLQQEQSLTI